MPEEMLLAKWFNPRLWTHNTGAKELELLLDGGLTQARPLDNFPYVHVGGDASEGPFSADPMKRQVAFAVVAVKWCDESSGWKAVGRLVANLTGSVKTVLLGRLLISLTV